MSRSRDYDYRTAQMPMILMGSTGAGQILKYGGQGRNRTADASLFRATIAQCYLLSSQSISGIGSVKMPPQLEQLEQLEQDQFTSPGSVLSLSTARRCDSGTNCV